jgi:hypothetical protein
VVGYQDLVEQIKISSAAVEDFANAGARIAICGIRTIQDLHHVKFIDLFNKILEKQAMMETSLAQICTGRNIEQNPHGTNKQ